MNKNILYTLALIWVFIVLVGICAFVTYALLTEPIVKYYIGGIVVLLITIVSATYLANNK